MFILNPNFSRKLLENAAIRRSGATANAEPAWNPPPGVMCPCRAISIDIKSIAATIMLVTTFTITVNSTPPFSSSSLRNDGFLSLKIAKHPITAR